jgi:hypothetical protein
MCESELAGFGQHLTAAAAEQSADVDRAGRFRRALALEITREELVERAAGVWCVRQL